MFTLVSVNLKVLHFKNMKNLNIHVFYNKYWNLRLKYDESLCKDQNHKLSLEKTNRENHQCATYNYASQKLHDKYFHSWCMARNCSNVGFLTEKIVKKTLQYFKIDNPIIEKNLFNFLGFYESRFIAFGLNYKKWKLCFKKSISKFNLYTIGDEVYLYRVLYLKYTTLTENDFQVFCMLLNNELNIKK